MTKEEKWLLAEFDQVLKGLVVPRLEAIDKRIAVMDERAKRWVAEDGALERARNQ